MATYRGGYVWRGSPALVAANAAIMAARPGAPADGRGARPGGQPVRVQRRGQPRCGTLAGWQLHRRRSEEPCQACRDAYAAYMRAYKQQRKAEKKRRDGVFAGGARREGGSGDSA